MEVVFWLLPDPVRSDGCMPLDTLLDGPRTFLAAGLTGGGSVLLSRDALLTVEIDAAAKGCPEMSEPGASLDVVTLHLDSGLEVAGVLRSWAPVGAARMSDVMNASGRFLTLGLGSRIVLVNRTRIARVSF
jgi:hypothetical protein